MPISLWLLCAVSLCHLMLRLYRKGIPLRCLKAASQPFETAFQTFCLGLWQDTSLSLSQLTRLSCSQPGLLQMKQKKKKASVTSSIFFFFLTETLLSFHSKSFLPDTEARAGPRGARGGGAEAKWESSLECLKWTYSFLSWPAPLRSFAPSWIPPQLPLFFKRGFDSSCIF